MIKKLSTLYLTLLVLICAVVAILSYFALLPERLDAEQYARADCVTTEFPSKSNGTGMVVSGHQQVCPDKKDVAIFRFYLHKQGVAESQESRVLRYENAQSAPMPKIEWEGDNIVLIRIGDILHLSKSISLVNGIHVYPIIGKQTGKATTGVFRSWSRSWATYETIVILFLILIFLCISSYKIVRLIQTSKKHHVQQ